MKGDFDFYDLLNVDEDASQEEIRTAFREQVRNYHPDLNDDPRAPAQFSALKKAYDTLDDQKERDAYDRMGHEEYVNNRISGLPSPDAWITADDGGDGSEADADTDDGTDESGSTGGGAGGGGSTTRESGGSGGRRSTNARAATESSSRTTEGSRTRSRSGNGGAASSADGAASGTAEADDASGSASAESARNRTGGTGAGTARGPDVGTGADAEREATDAAAAGTERESVGTRLWSGVESTFAATVGWPLILAADVLFLVSLGLYAAASATGVNALVDRIAAAGADPGAIGSALGTRPAGFESLSSFVGAELTASPVTGMLVLVGIAFFPSVYFFMVRWTRKNRRPWQPSYLYVVGAVSPMATLLASMLVDVPGVYAEVVGFFLVPVATIAAMLFFAQVKPRVARVYRRWRYRHGS
jgi:curved DNA-binding protein CbpA